jgi:hypothetical protein
MPFHFIIDITFALTYRRLISILDIRKLNQQPTRKLNAASLLQFCSASAAAQGYRNGATSSAPLHAGGFSGYLHSKYLILGQLAWPNAVPATAPYQRPTNRQLILAIST